MGNGESGMGKQQIRSKSTRRGSQASCFDHSPFPIPHSLLASHSRLLNHSLFPIPYSRITQ
jgi:hypothetical protein